MLTSTRDFLTTESTIDAKAAPNDIVAFLKRARTTGQLVFHMSQGSVQRIGVIERTRATARESDSIRAALNMETPAEDSSK